MLAKPPPLSLPLMCLWKRERERSNEREAERGASIIVLTSRAPCPLLSPLPWKSGNWKYVVILFYFTVTHIWELKLTVLQVVTFRIVRTRVFQVSLLATVISTAMPCTLFDNSMRKHEKSCFLLILHYCTNFCRLKHNMCVVLRMCTTQTSRIYSQKLCCAFASCCARSYFW